MQEAAEITVSSVMQSEVGSFELYSFLLKWSVRINLKEAGRVQPKCSTVGRGGGMINFSSQLCSTSAEFEDDGSLEAQFFIVFFSHVANVFNAQSLDITLWWYVEN